MNLKVKLTCTSTVPDQDMSKNLVSYHLSNYVTSYITCLPFAAVGPSLPLIDFQRRINNLVDWSLFLFSKYAVVHFLLCTTI